MFSKLKKVVMGVVGFALGFMAMNAHAVIDITGVTTGITDAQTAITNVITALLALSVALFGIVKVYRFVSAKSGA